MITQKDEIIKLDVLADDGTKKEYDVILMYDSDVTQKRYCFYTDGTKNANGDIQIRVGSVGKLNDNIVMEEITNPIEREMISRDYAKFMQENK